MDPFSAEIRQSGINETQSSHRFVFKSNLVICASIANNHTSSYRYLPATLHITIFGCICSSRKQIHTTRAPTPLPHKQCDLNTGSKTDLTAVLPQIRN